MYILCTYTHLDIYLERQLVMVSVFYLYVCTQFTLMYTMSLKFFVACYHKNHNETKLDIIQSSWLAPSYALS